MSDERARLQEAANRVLGFRRTPPLPAERVTVTRSDLQWLLDRFPLCDPDAPTDAGALSSTAVGDSDAGGDWRQNAGAMREALEWYAEQVASCRKIGSAGDSFRHALDADGGKRALAAIRNLTDDGAGA